jgi:hypothetical protein
MEFIEDVRNYKPARDIISKYGFAAEHNLDWYLYEESPKKKAILATWGDERALLAYREEKYWTILGEPIAPQEMRADMIIEFAKAVLNENQPTIDIELISTTREDLLTKLPENIKARKVNYVLTWPVMNMEKYDPLLPGGHFKSIRNAKNKFLKEHSFEVVSADTVEKEILHNLIKVWIKDRVANDRVYPNCYHNCIDGGFEGLSTARALIVDGKPCGLNAGFEIPNSDKGYYGCIGIHDYSFRDLGLMLYIEDLEWLKKAGYKKADMGGGEENLTKFKNQFLPESWYETFVFSIGLK